MGLWLLGGGQEVPRKTENKGAEAGKCCGDKNLSLVCPGRLRGLSERSVPNDRRYVAM